MKRISALFLLLPLVGCYNIFLVNVGGVTKQASSVGLPTLTPESQCIVLLGPELTKQGLKAEQACLRAVAAQKELDEGKRRNKP